MHVVELEYQRPPPTLPSLATVFPTSPATFAPDLDLLTSTLTLTLALKLTLTLTLT